MRRSLTLVTLGLFSMASPALASAPFACAGAAMLGGAQIVCSHTDPMAPPQVCTFSWTLAGAGGTLSTVEGSFLLTPGLTNATVYQGSGASYALSPPIVLCQGRKS